MSAIELGKIVEQLNELQSNYEDIKKTINALKLDNQRKVDSNVQIPPGIATKVAYDMNGLIVKGNKLEVSDIPSLPIDVIEGLRKALDSKVNKKDLQNIEIHDDNTLKKGAIIGSGSIINYDANGLVVSSSDLKPTDIPDLPISKIEGLSEILDLIKATTDNTDTSDKHDLHSVVPGTHTKITYDANGKIVNGSDLSMDDIPMELLSKINMVESKIPLLASQHSVDALNSSIIKKLDSNENITPGTFTKVKVDSKGLVIGGEKIDKTDLPVLEVSDIENLEYSLRNKCDQSDFINLSDTVSMVVTALSKIPDINGLLSKVELKADSQTVVTISNQLTTLQNLVDTILDKIPSELILTQLSKIEGELTNLSGRITVLERKVSKLEG